MNAELLEKMQKSLKNMLRMKTKLAEYLEHFLLIKDVMAELTQLDGV